MVMFIKANNAIANGSGSQNFMAFFGYQNGVLKLSCSAVVCCHHSPSITKDRNFDTSICQHRLLKNKVIILISYNLIT